MRGKAFQSGNLKTSEQQTITQTKEKIIVIESSSPQVVYVPSYSPVVVYGAWYYPSWYYPYLYVPPPPGYGALAFTVGVAWGAAVWGGCHWGWGHTDIDIDINRYNNFTQNTYNRPEHHKINNGTAGGGRSSWQHNAEHRQGVNYRNNATAQKYGGTGVSNRVTREQARGWSKARPQQQAAGTRDLSSRAAAAGTRDVSPRTPSAGTKPRPTWNDRSYSNPGGGRTSAYSGARSPSFDRSASTRGASSRATTSFGGSRGGGSRPSGGGGRRR